MISPRACHVYIFSIPNSGDHVSSKYFFISNWCALTANGYIFILLIKAIGYLFWWTISLFSQAVSTGLKETERWQVCVFVFLYSWEGFTISTPLIVFWGTLWITIFLNSQFMLVIFKRNVLFSGYIYQINPIYR